MNAFATLLWKEWRDHRAALIACFVGLPPLIVAGMKAIPEWMRLAEPLPSFAAVVGFAIAALTLFGDVFAGEEQRGTISLLRRLPVGLGRVFAAKMSLSLFVAIAMAGWAYAIATVTTATLHGGPWFPPLSVDPLAWLALVLPLATWIPVAAIWLSRATLAIPAASLMLALFAAPMGVLAWKYPWLKPTRGELTAAFWMLTFSGPMVAGVSFVVGRRSGARSLAPVRCGLIAALVLFTPAYAWSGAHVARHMRVEPAGSSFRIESSAGALASTGRFAYVQAFHVSADRDRPGIAWHDPELGDSPLHPLCVDLATGKWRRIGPIGARLVAPGSAGPSDLRFPTPVVGVFDERVIRLSLRRDDPGWQLVDAVRGEPFDDARTEELFRQAGMRAGALLRETCYVQLYDGRRAWRQDDQIFVDPGRALPDSRFQEPPIFWSFASAGLGVRVGDDEWYDVARERRYRVPPMTWVRFIRPTRWIVFDCTDLSAGAFLFDPDTGERSPVAGDSRNEQWLGLADDGRLLAVPHSRSIEDPPPTLALLDPESGRREPVRIESPAATTVQRIELVGRTPSGAALIRLSSPRWTWFARLDLDGRFGTTGGARLTVSERVDCAVLLGAASESELVVIEDHRRLVRVPLGTGHVEILFPR